MLKSIQKISHKHYIQCGLAVLLTGIILYFTASLWSYKNIVVSFNTKLSKDIQYQVFYTEASGQSFNGDQLVRKDVKSGTRRVEIVLPIEKIVRFRLDIDQNPGEVEISDFQIKGSGKIKFDYNEFNKNQINKFKVKDGKLYLTSNQIDPYIWYKKDLNITSGLRVDWCRLIIISVLAFLLMYKFVQYLSRFKIEKHHSRIDIVMLAAFFGLLFIPMSHISDAEKSEQENRMLAKKPQLIIDGTGGGNYGLQFDAWYNDHFFGRSAMTYLYNYLKYMVAPMSENNTSMVGKDGFLWNKEFKAIDIYKRTNLFTNEELDIIGENIEKFVNDAKMAGIKSVYFMLSNDKESMYSEYYPFYIKKVGSISRLEQLIDYIHKKYPQIRFFNFRDKFEDIKKKENVFYKTGTHMNNVGAYYEYYFLSSEIKKDYPDIDILELDDFDVYVSDSIDQPDIDLDIYKKFLVLPRYSVDNYKNKIFKYTMKGNLSCKERPHGNFCKGINVNVKNKLTVFAISDSFMGRYYKYLADTFYKVDRIFWGFGKDFVLNQEEIKYLYENIPDIFIVETTERFLHRFLTLKFPQNLIKEN